MKVFEKIITVSKADLDQNNHVNNVRYVQWVQDVAEAHWLSNTSKAITENYFWVLVKHTIEYKNEALLGDTLRLKTFVSKLDGISSIRHVEIYNTANNKRIVTSETKWCFMNADTKRPTKIPEDIITSFL